MLQKLKERRREIFQNIEHLGGSLLIINIFSLVKIIFLIFSPNDMGNFNLFIYNHSALGYLQIILNVIVILFLFNNFKNLFKQNNQIKLTDISVLMNLENENDIHSTDQSFLFHKIQNQTQINKS